MLGRPGLLAHAKLIGRAIALGFVCYFVVAVILIAVAEPLVARRYLEMTQYFWFGAAIIAYLVLLFVSRTRQRQ